MKARRDLHCFALREFEYDQETGVVDRGQVVELRGHRNDQKLIRVRYLAPCYPGQDLVQCGVCGAFFVDEQARQCHGDLRHKYECECGWRPGREVRDKAASLRAHRARCDAARSELERARTVQRQEIAAQPGREQGIDAGQSPPEAEEDGEDEPHGD